MGEITFDEVKNQYRKTAELALAFLDQQRDCDGKYRGGYQNADRLHRLNRIFVEKFTLTTTFALIDSV